MDALAFVAIIVIGLLVVGLAAVRFGADTRDDMTDDHKAPVQPAS